MNGGGGREGEGVSSSSPKLAPADTHLPCLSHPAAAPSGHMTAAARHTTLASRKAPDPLFVTPLESPLHPAIGYSAWVAHTFVFFHKSLGEGKRESALF